MEIYTGQKKWGKLMVLFFFYMTWYMVDIWIQSYLVKLSRKPEVSDVIRPLMRCTGIKCKWLNARKRIGWINREQTFIEHICCMGRDSAKTLTCYFL